jgi:glycine/D-amino acid oxidase-like deaminating enzyme
LHTHTPVTGVEALDDFQDAADALPRRWALQTPRGRTACAHVVHAGNAYVPALLPGMRGARGIVPVRGQALAVRAAVPARGLSTASFDSANEYWFPRPVSDGAEAPLVIIGGAREFSATKELDTVDDATVSSVVGAELRRYLPYTFPGMYNHAQDPEMEWVSRALHMSRWTTCL